MKNLITSSFAIIVFIFGTSVYSQNVTVSGALTGNGNYTTIGAAFTAINAGAQTNASIVISINGNTNEFASAVLNAGTWTSLTINPSGTRTVTGNLAAPLIDLNGADNVTIDGLGTGGNALTISNTSISAAANTSTIRFRNDASQNTIKHCTILGSSRVTTLTNGGTIFFSTGATTGNDNNTITICNIGPAGVNLPTKAIYGSGSSATILNEGININNCNIFDFFNSAAQSNGVYISNGCSDWTLDNNKFYQTAARTTTANGVLNAPIQLASSNINNCQINNNTIGNSSSAGTGTYTLNGAFGNSFFGIYASALGTTTASTFSKNIIQNITFSNTPNIPSTAWFAGINVVAGAANISNNTIGADRGLGSITISYNTSAQLSFIYGIRNAIGAAGDINSNTIGSFTIGGTSTNTVIFRGISRTGAIPSSVSVSSNMVGSTNNTNSIRVTNNTRPYEIEAIYSTVTSNSITFDNNVIANITNTSTSASSIGTAGIFYSGTSNPSITNNTIFGLTDNTNSSSANTLLGIWSASSSVSQTISWNTINNLIQSSTNSGVVTGLIVNGTGSIGTISKNKLYNINVPNAISSGNESIGINVAAGSWVTSNNQISLTIGTSSLISRAKTQNSYENPESPAGYIQTDDIITGSSGTPVSMVRASHLKFQKSGRITGNGTQSPDAIDIFSAGILDNAPSGESNSYYYNSVYIGGSLPTGGNSPSYGYIRQGASTVNLKNNIFYNTRTAGASSQFAIGNDAVSPATGWNSNYNVLISPAATTIGEWGGASQDIDQLRTSSSQEKQSWSTISALLSASNLFTDITTGNLNIQNGNGEAWIVNGKGLPVNGQNSDYSGNTRSTSVFSGVSDIGSNEITIDPAVNLPPSANASGTPGSGLTTTYSLWGRTIASVDWSSGGTSYPTSLDVKYYSGVNPTNVLGGNYSNSYTSFAATGTLAGATYDITYLFGDNETGNITAPNSNTLLAKFDPTSWEVFQPGTGQYQTQLTYDMATETYSAKVAGLFNFSDYALTDKNSPLPVTLAGFSGSILGRDVKLSWVTLTEVNNRGFYIERRNKLSANTYTDWQSLGFVQGHGNSNINIAYSYTDSKLNLGSYQYRLKQVDYNGNTEYHNTTGQSDIVIGKPMASDMFQNYPNPSNPKTKIDYQLPFDSKVSIKIYDLTGREVVTLVDKTQDAGYYSAEFDGTNLASGIYFYRIIAQGASDKFTKTLKMVLVK